MESSRYQLLLSSPQPTASCLNGRSTVVTLRCDPEKSARGELTVPSKCPAGTCNGCEFHFLWESSSACPLCTETDYHSIEGACKGGVQDTLYVWNEPKVCIKGVPLPNKTSAHCEVVTLWVKAGIGGGAFMAVLLVCLTCYFFAWLQADGDNSESVQLKSSQSERWVWG